MSKLMVFVIIICFAVIITVGCGWCLTIDTLETKGKDLVSILTVVLNWILLLCEKILPLFSGA